jgi:precorrin-6A/cobalt-precorrin-6A reductase
MSSRKAILILGGTAEAAALAEQASSRFDITYSLAGRTANPALPDHVAVRTGGFGGADALADWVTENGIAAVIDATHPFADRIALNAAKACTRLQIPRLKLVRAAWQKMPGDNWRPAADVAEAATLIPHYGRRAFLSVGRQELAAFSDLDGAELVIRSIDPQAEGDLLPGATYITGRGPFTMADEVALFRGHKIDVLVSKNAGGDATYAKIAAARQLSLPVIMIDRPAPPPGNIAATAGEALNWLRDGRDDNEKGTVDG